ncbi:MAG TPA: hypothetical protein VGI93_09485 [Steroidobacteraceae bacterium]
MLSSNPTSKDTLHSLFRHLVRPARGGAIAVVVGFALLFSLAMRAGLMGLPLLLVLLSWFYKYAFILFDHVSRGMDDPPVLDIQMMNPVDEQRPLAQVAIMGLALGAVIWSYTSIGVVFSSVLGALFLILMPAEIAVLGLEGNIIRAANPFLWARMAWSLGPIYPILLAFIALEAIIIAALARMGLWRSIDIAIGMFGTLSVFSVLAGSLYERRDEVGLETWRSPERTAAKERHDSLKADQALVTEAYGLLRAREHNKSWQLLHGWLEDHDFNPDAYRWLLDRTTSWEDARYTTRLTQELIERLLQSKRTGEALDAVSERLKMDSSFRPKSAGDTLAIAQLAARGGGARGVARTLLSDFTSRFPEDPRAAIAAKLTEHLRD